MLVQFVFTIHSLYFWRESLPMKNRNNIFFFQKYFISCLVSLFCISSSSKAQRPIIDSLIQLYQQSTTIEDSITYSSKIAFYSSTSNPDSALTLAEKSLATAQRINFSEGIASCYNSIGWILFKKGKYHHAEKEFSKALTIYSQLKDDEALMSVYLNLSSVFIARENYADALKVLQNTLPLIEKYPNHIQVTGIYKNLGIVYRELKEYDKAESYFQNAIEVNLKTNHAVLAADIRISLGILLTQRDKYPEALKQYDEAYNAYKEEKTLLGMGIARENLGDLFFKQKDYSKSLSLYKEALHYYETLESKSDIAYIKLNIARVNTITGRFHDAVKNLEEALQFAKETGASNYRMDILAQLSETYQKAGNYVQALKFYKEFQLLKDSIKSDEQIMQLNRVRTEFETEQKDRQIALLNAEQLLQKEKSKQRSILVIALIVISILLMITVYARTKLFRKKKILLEKEKQIARQQQQQTEQMLLRSQMNPHFIFNSLNTIDSFVLQNKKEDASEMIQRFSRLARQILEYSAENEISIGEELDMCKVYLQIEQIRHNHRFNFEIQETTEIRHYKIPPMIIQPFVENAVLHGIRNKPGNNGQIKIQTLDEGKKIKFIITDNGVGRKRAAEIKSQQMNTHESKAMHITTSRLKTLHNNNNIADFIHYTDLEAEEGGESGTMLEVYIPKLSIIRKEDYAENYNS